VEKADPQIYQNGIRRFVLAGVLCKKVVRPACVKLHPLAEGRKARPGGFQDFRIGIDAYGFQVRELAEKRGQVAAFSDGGIHMEFPAGSRRKVLERFFE
jgi:hypothetical protein